MRCSEKQDVSFPFFAAGVACLWIMSGLLREPIRSVRDTVLHFHSHNRRQCHGQDH
jgi:hypothetical protein